MNLKTSTSKKILIGYIIIILFGTLLLTLPVSKKGAGGTSFLDCLFTATSATCVTGLVRYDTYTHWTVFGQLVILFLIQVGGVGFMTFAVSIIALTKRKISLSERVAMKESIAAPSVGGIVRLSRFVIIETLIVELIGAVLLSFAFVPLFGYGKGIYFAVFHSISAFCNAGFDLMGGVQEFSSLAYFAENPYVNIVVCVLIVTGGLGFFVLHDLIGSRFNLKKLKVHSKIVITVSALLIIFGTLLILIFENGAALFARKSAGERILISLFQSVTARTAGFSTVDLTRLTPASQMLITCLMLVGGSSGSTAGGMKTTTFAIVVLSVIATFKRRKSIECFGRRFDENTVIGAASVMVMYILCSIFGAMIISSTDTLPMAAALFETASAMGTTGLSLNLSPNLGVVSQLTVIFLMLIGRVGSITILLSFSSTMGPKAVSRLPLAKVQIG